MYDGLFCFDDGNYGDEFFNLYSVRLSNLTQGIEKTTGLSMELTSLNSVKRLMEAYCNISKYELKHQKKYHPDMCAQPVRRRCLITKTCPFKYIENFTTKYWVSR